jgi:GxxExxY protein
MLLFEELSRNIIGAAMEVHRHLGPGFLEAVYGNALAYELLERKLSFLKEEKIIVLYKDKEVGEYEADFIVENKIILELKATSSIVPAHVAQTIN